jgi:putative phage-type endonuclease
MHQQPHEMLKVGSEEWLEARRNYITATDLPVIMGKSKWKTLKSLYQEKVEGAISPQNEAMRRGTEMEAEARSKFETLNACLVYPVFTISKLVPWAAASLDGWNEDGIMVEIKCPGKEDHEKALKGQVPDHYFHQLQWQMFVAGLDEMYYFSYLPTHVNPYSCIKVKRHEEVIEDMREKAQDFYFQILNKMPPSVENGAGADAFSEDTESLENELAGLISLTKEFSERIDQIKEILIEKCNGKKTKGKRVCFSPIETKGAIQYDKIPQLEGLDLESFRKPSFMKWRVDLI